MTKVFHFLSNLKKGAVFVAISDKASMLMFEAAPHMSLLALARARFVLIC